MNPGVRLAEGSPQSILAVFAKTPRPGRVKTRLAAEIGDHVAALLHRLLVDYTLRSLGEVADRRLLAFTPATDEAAWRRHLGPSWQAVAQSTDDLGHRLARCFAEQLSSDAPDEATAPREPETSRGPTGEPARRMVIVGTDCPWLTAGHVASALDALQQMPVVLGPAHDGGYYLIGLRGPWSQRLPPLFEEIPWGTAAVAEATRDACRRVGLEWHELTPLSDLDRPADLRQLLADCLAGTVADDPLREEVMALFDLRDALLRDMP
jgi:hypothetical protein